MITTSVFDKLEDGREVIAYTMTDGDKKAVVLNYGGIIQSLVVPDKEGNPVDVLLGYDNVAGYRNNGGFLSALIGRFGNRIGEGKMTIDGVAYQLYNNDRGNHLHGGKEGFDRKMWDAEILCSECNRLQLTYVSPDGEENYPGTLTVKVVYSFKDGVFGIEYTATTDKKTVVNLTNHAYFNLNGQQDGSILDNVLFIDSDKITPTNATMIPVGGFKAVQGTPFDFTSPKAIGDDVDSDDIDMVQGGGYDHCYVLKNKCGEMVDYAIAESKKTGIKMTCSTDMPAVQFYCGNGLNQDGKGGVHYGKRAGFCLETQAIPNNVNVPEYAAYGSSLLDKGETYHFTAKYKFEA